MDGYTPRPRRLTIDELLQREARQPKVRRVSPLLTSDWHLTDDPADEYRWQIIESVLQAVIQYHVEIVFILGDIVDRKDRHSGALVNRLVAGLKTIAGRAQVVVLRGNHDTPLKGPAFWEFLSEMLEITYITAPTTWHLFSQDEPDLLLLPFSVNPKQAWQGIRFTDYKAMFMHATVTGAKVENGTIMQNSKFPLLPRSVPVYSGDVHVPQTVQNIVYVGAPHPIKYGDKYPGRMLLLDEEFGIKLEIPVVTPRKHMVDIASIEELRELAVKPGDRVRIRLQCSPADIGEWGQTEAAIHRWAAANGVIVAGTEVVIEGVHDPVSGGQQTPQQILEDFAAREGLTPDLIAVGRSLLGEIR